MSKTAEHAAPNNAPEDMTPAGLQPMAVLRRRRAIMALLCALTFAALLWGVSLILGAGRWTWIDIGILASIMISAPWTVLGFWNAALGLWLLRAARDPLGKVSPFLAEDLSDRPIAGRVAVLLTLRNEEVARAYQRLIAMRASLDAAGDGAAFDVFILSDSTDPAIIDAEERLFDANHPALAGMGAAFYRRRTRNDGFKAGNVRDFLECWGDDYALMIPLDADSIMSGGAMARMARIAERHPKIGILQSLAVGAPADSPFARIFQFGMRHGMRSFTTGSAWWQGECGPFWGHNAVVRVAPFKAHCALPVLPGKPPLGGHILSHDQVEAALMRRAGYEVRVIPVEGDSWEENPVTLLDFMKREQRWCNGNMQYWPLLGLPGLPLTSRFQLLQAILMYLAPPAWMLMTLLAALKVFETDPGAFNASLAIGLFFAMFAMSLAPKLAGVIDVLAQRGGVARYGGAGRFLAGTGLEILFSMLMAPAMALRLTLFLIGLPFGKRIAWDGQIRDAYGLNWSTAWRALWPQVLFGTALCAILAVMQPMVLPWAAPVLAGLILAPVFAVATASPRVGRALARARLVSIPEEINAHPMLSSVPQTGLNQTPPEPATAIAAE